MPLSHTGPDGAPHMVDVGDKPETQREATAEAFVVCAPSTLVEIAANRGPKGDALAVARLAALQAPKRTPELVPLCHPLRISSVEVDLELVQPDRVRVWARVRAVERTGVEMEALTAVLVGALTLYDMVKAIDRGATITEARVLTKQGGKTGTWVRQPAP
ncbi:MAG: cyclic pyranopterin monophosphate synthase MoaC [Polyangia bacterium]